MSTPKAFVPGASRGIGRAISVALARAGYDVAISARTLSPGEVRDNTTTVRQSDLHPLPGSLRDTEAEILALGRRALVAPADLTDRSTVVACAAYVLQSWGAPDLIVHSGRYIGPGLMDSFLETPVESYDFFLAAHCIAPVLLTRSFLPGMLVRGAGTVITITSNAAYESPPAPPGAGGWGLAYSVGKSAGHALTGTLHAEYSTRGINAFNVHPGFVGTERNLRGSTAAFRDHFGQPAPPDAIGAVISWLACAPEASQLRGKTIEGQTLCLEYGLYPDWRS